MEGSSVKWAEFNVINSIGSSDYTTRRYAYLTLHIVIDSDSTGIIMLTNLFKKVPPLLILGITKKPELDRMFYCFKLPRKYLQQGSRRNFTIVDHELTRP
jgi:hypothetical protein